MPGSLRRNLSEPVTNMTILTSNLTDTEPPVMDGVPHSHPDPAREKNQVARVSKESDVEDRTSSTDQQQSVRLSVNLSTESADTLRTLIRRKGLSITEGIRRAIAVWNFVEDEAGKGNEIAVIEHDGSVTKVVLL